MTAHRPIEQDHARPGILHLVDTLDAGGAERVAVNLANLLPRDRFRPFLGTTRRDGALAELIASDVGRIALGRRFRLDPVAQVRLSRFLQAHDIRILHPHGSAILVAVLASMFPPYPAVVWHDHVGRYGFETRSRSVYRALTRRVRHTITVSAELAEWAETALGMSRDRVTYIPNFACDPPVVSATPIDLPGVAGARLICVANLRWPKDQPTLVRAMARVVQERGDAHLILVGAGSDPEYRDTVLALIRELDLERNITWLGPRFDVPLLLDACDIGVLSSASEALPLALIEYGLHGLPTVATRVGQCPDVLDGGRAGRLVEPGDSEALAGAILELLRSESLRSELGERLHQRIDRHYSARAAIERIGTIYDGILERGIGCRVQVSEPLVTR